MTLPNRRALSPIRAVWLVVEVFRLRLKFGNFVRYPAAWDRAAASVASGAPSRSFSMHLLQTCAWRWRDPYRARIAEAHLETGNPSEPITPERIWHFAHALAWIDGVVDPRLEELRYEPAGDVVIGLSIVRSIAAWRRSKAVPPDWPAPAQRIGVVMPFEWMGMLLDAMESESRGNFDIAFEQYRKAFHLIPSWLDESRYARKSMDDLLRYSGTPI